MKEPKINRCPNTSVPIGTPSRKFLFKQFIDAQSTVLSNKYPFLSASQIHKKATELWSRLTPGEREAQITPKRLSTPKTFHRQKKKIFTSQNCDIFSSPTDSVKSFSTTGAEKKYGESSGLHIHKPAPEVIKQDNSQSILKKKSDVKKSKVRVSFSDENNNSKHVNEEEMKVNGGEYCHHPSDTGPCFVTSVPGTNSENVDNNHLDTPPSRETVKRKGKHSGTINSDLGTLNMMVDFPVEEGGSVVECDYDNSINTSVVTPVKLFRNENSPKISPQLLVANKAVASDMNSKLLMNVYNYFDDEILEPAMSTVESKRRDYNPISSQHANKSTGKKRGRPRKSKQHDKTMEERTYSEKKFKKCNRTQQNQAASKVGNENGKVDEVSKRKKESNRKDKNKKIPKNKGNKQAGKNEYSLKRKMPEEMCKSNFSQVKKKRGRPAKKRPPIENNRNKCDLVEENDFKIVGKYCLRKSKQNLEHVESCNSVSIPKDKLKKYSIRKTVTSESLHVNANTLASGIRKICPLFDINEKDAELLKQLNEKQMKPRKGKKIGSNAKTKRSISMCQKDTTLKRLKTVAVVKRKNYQSVIKGPVSKQTEVSPGNCTNVPETIEDCEMRSVLPSSQNQRLLFNTEMTNASLNKTRDIYTFEEDEGGSSEQFNMVLHNNLSKSKNYENAAHSYSKTKLIDADPIDQVSLNDKTGRYISQGEISKNRKGSIETDVHEMNLSEEKTPEKSQFKVSKRIKTLSKVKRHRKTNNSQKIVKSKRSKIHTTASSVNVTDKDSLVSSPNIGSYTVDSSDDSESERCVQLFELNRALQNNIVHHDGEIESNRKHTFDENDNQFPEDKNNLEIENVEGLNLKTGKPSNKADIRNYFSVVSKNSSSIETNYCGNNIIKRQSDVSETIFREDENCVSDALCDKLEESGTGIQNKLDDTTIGISIEASKEGHYGYMVNDHSQESESSINELIGINQSMHNNRMNDIYNTKLTSEQFKDSPVCNQNIEDIVIGYNACFEFGSHNAEIYPTNVNVAGISGPHNQNLPDIVPVNTQNIECLEEKNGCDGRKLDKVVESGFKVPDIPKKLKSSKKTPVSQMGNIKKLITPQTDDNLIKITMEKVSKAPHKKLLVTNDKSPDELIKAKKARKSLKHIVTSLVNNKQSTETNFPGKVAHTKLQESQKLCNLNCSGEKHFSVETSNFVDENGNEQKSAEPKHKNGENYTTEKNERGASMVTSFKCNMNPSSVDNRNDGSEFLGPSFMSMIATASLMETASHEIEQNLKSLEDFPGKSPDMNVISKSSSRWTLDNALRSLRDIASSQSTIALDDIDSVFSQSNNSSPALSGIAEFMEEAVENVINVENDVFMAENTAAGLDYSNATLEKALTSDAQKNTSNYFQNSKNNREVTDGNKNEVSTDVDVNSAIFNDLEHPKQCVSRQVAALAHLVSIPEYQRELPHNVNRTLMDLFDEPEKQTPKKSKEEEKTSKEKIRKEREELLHAKEENFFL